ncbi:MAG: 50S ribosomal protein L18e [Candidatus Lokiarchaeota archaeon]|nr:50S ribosomal protein L18e [Candidatus Lokiarchaeota archaeon]
MIKPLKSTNPLKHDLLIKLWSTKRRSWRTVAKKLSKSKKESIRVNLSKINKLTKENDIIVVPGKILGDGNLDHKLTLAAFSFSETTRNKLLQNKIKILTIEELLESNPKGSKIKIIT